MSVNSFLSTDKSDILALCILFFSLWLLQIDSSANTYIKVNIIFILIMNLPGRLTHDATLQIRTKPYPRVQKFGYDQDKFLNDFNLGIT